MAAASSSDSSARACPALSTPAGNPALHVGGQPEQAEACW
jgi:hypothetical protein